MKKTSLILIILILLLSPGCSAKDAATGAGQSAPIKMAVLNGPTGIGSVKLFNQPEKYDMAVYQSPDEISGKIITGEVDVAAVPSNLAAVIYNKTEGQIVALSPVALGVLYIMQNTEGEAQVISSIGDLRGKTILAGGKGSTAEYILDKLLLSAGLDPASDVTLKWFANHTEVTTEFLTTPGAVAMLPEPFVSIVLSKSDNVKTVLDLNSEWKAATGDVLTMSVLVAQKSFVEERPGDVEGLLSDYRNSIDFVNGSPDAPQLISELGFISDVEIAKKAIPGCNLFMPETRDESAFLLKSFYGVLFEADPKSIGGSLPDENFYY